MGYQLCNKIRDTTETRAYKPLMDKLMKKGTPGPVPLVAWIWKGIHAVPSPATEIVLLTT